jgi:hypothetical protein
MGQVPSVQIMYVLFVAVKDMAVESKSLVWEGLDNTQAMRMDLNDQCLYITSDSRQYFAHISTAGMSAVKGLANAKPEKKTSADAAMTETLHQRQ